MTLAAGLKEKPPRDTQRLRPHTNAPHLSRPKAPLQGQGTFLLPGTPFPGPQSPWRAGPGSPASLGCCVPKV